VGKVSHALEWGSMLMIPSGHHIPQTWLLNLLHGVSIDVFLAKLLRKGRIQNPIIRRSKHEDQKISANLKN
jgi:hypothetical protein